MSLTWNAFINEVLVNPNVTRSTLSPDSINVRDGSSLRRISKSDFESLNRFQQEVLIGSLQNSTGGTMVDRNSILNTGSLFSDPLSTNRVDRANRAQDFDLFGGLKNAGIGAVIALVAVAVFAVAK